MKFQKIGFKTGAMGLVLCAVIVAISTGCSDHRDRSQQRDVYIAPPAVVVMQDDYIYYPYYQVYYSSSRRQYAYRQGNSWVSQPAPRGVTVNVLMASPSVKMNFHDAPANHHAAVAKQYPKNWAPPGQNHGQKEKHQSGQQDGNNGR